MNVIDTSRFSFVEMGLLPGSDTGLYSQLGVSG